MRILCTLLGLWLSVVPVVAQSLVVRNANGDIIGPLYADKIAVKVPASRWQHWNSDDDTPLEDRVILIGPPPFSGQLPPGSPTVQPDAFYETVDCTGSAYTRPVVPGWPSAVTITASGYAWLGGTTTVLRSIRTRYGAGRCTSMTSVANPAPSIVAPVQYLLLADLPFLVSPLSVDIVPGPVLPQTME